MQVNVDADVSQAVWKKYDVEGETQVKIKPMTPTMLRTTRANNIDTRNTKVTSLEKVNDEEWDKDLFDELIEDWKGFIDKNDKPIPCTRDNKIIVIEKFNSIKQWVLAEARELAEEIAQVKKGKAKN